MELIFDFLEGYLAQICEYFSLLRKCFEERSLHGLNEHLRHIFNTAIKKKR